MTHASVFGYGSLVNLRTHTHRNPRPAEATGWRRVWRNLAGQDYATLSVTRAPDTTIQGMIADVADADWDALDAREASYVRQTLPCGTAIYEVQNKIVLPPEPHPILRSYLDVVVQGYLDHFGEAGVQHFFASTDNWGPVLDDRLAPIYPRHQSVTFAVTSLVDHHLTAQVQ